MRAELTLSTARYFQVYRRTDDPHSAWAGRAISQSTADRQYRAVVWQPAWDRYCCARAAGDDTSTLEELTAVVERRVR